MITNEKVLQKMQQEIQTALSKKDQHAEVKEHARAIRLLCDLILDQEEAQAPIDTSKAAGTHNAQDELELRKMMGDISASKPNTGNVSTDSKKMQEDDANGDSLLDF